MRYIVPCFLHRLIWFPSRFVFSVLLRSKINGRENLKDLDYSKGIIIMSNHVRALDPLIVLATFPFFSRLFPLHTLSLERKEYLYFWFNWIYGGWFAKMLGSYPVKRGLDDLEVQLKDYIKLLEEKRTMLIFPEGGMTRTGEFGQPKRGATFLAKRTGAIVVPICICGAYKASLFDLLLGKRKITVEIGKPFRYSGDDPKQTFNEIQILHHI
jgi:1-acyl-sn-glycerol-3-phosphate acyltransferase